MSLVPRFPLLVAGILLIGLLSIGYAKMEMEKNIQRKEAAIRGSNMAKIFSLLMADESIARNGRILQRYLDEVGTDPDIYFIEMILDNGLVAGYQKNPSEGVEDVYMVSYPLSIEGGKSGSLKVGFLKTKVGKGIGRAKAIMGAGLISIASLFLGLLAYTRFRASPNTHRSERKKGGPS
jgi:hypothetical protein